MKYIQKKWLFISVGFFSFVAINRSTAQFAPAVGEVGTTAIYKDSSAIIAWATSCSLTLGPQDLSANPLSYPNTGGDSSGVGKADGIYVVSLGDGGSAVLEFEFAIKNGEGPDFAVFENGFDNTFLELAFVEVSSDGVNYVRFPAISNTSTAPQVATFGTLDATKLNNLAGKYRGTYGVPFDLEELKDSVAVDVNSITHVRVVDVVGSVNPLYASFDSQGNIVNDPWPTNFSSSGFDLDGVGVLHNINPNSTVEISNNEFAVFPNPVDHYLFVSYTGKHPLNEIVLSNSLGRIVSSFKNVNQIDVSQFPAGLYYLIASNSQDRFTQKIVISHE